MQIRIEIDVKPEELRRFLGLPDIAGLQDDLVDFLKEKLGAEQFDPAAFVRDGAQLLRDKNVIKRLLAAARVNLGDDGEADAPAAAEPAPAASRSRATTAAAGGSKRAPRPAPRPATPDPAAGDG